MSEALRVALHSFRPDAVRYIRDAIREEGAQEKRTSKIDNTIIILSVAKDAREKALTILNDIGRKLLISTDDLEELINEVKANRPGIILLFSVGDVSVIEEKLKKSLCITPSRTAQWGLQFPQ